MVIGAVQQVDGKPKKDKDGNNIDAIDWDEQEGNHTLHRWILAAEQGSEDEEWETFDDVEVLQVMKEAYAGACERDDE